MFHISNCLIGILNVLTLIISFPIIGVGLWLRSNADTECERVFLWPILITGLILMVVALLGLFGACCNVSSFLWLYLCVMFFVVIGLLSFTVFAVVVTSRGVGEAVSRKGLVEDKLGDFSKWLRNRVVENETWSSIKSCMVETGVCDSFHLLDSKEVDDFYLSTLSSIKSGCCKPPPTCGYQQVNATYWKAPKGPSSPNGTDCKAWSNDQKRLCFDCISCKAVVLANITSQWKKLAIFNACLLAFLILVYSIACCAFRNTRKGNDYHRYMGYH